MITITEEIDLTEFNWWGGAVDTYNTIEEAGKVEKLENLIKDVLGDNISKTDLNDYLWFDYDIILEKLDINTEEDDDEYEDDEE